MATASKSQVSTIDDKPAVSEVVESAAIAKGIPGASGKRELFTIYSSNEPGGQDPVECGLNGYAFQIKRDVPVNVPEELVQVFRNAITTSYDANGTPTNRPRYAFSSQPA